jgi:signal transduction histidine kinase
MTRDDLLLQDRVIQSIYGVSLTLEEVVHLIEENPALAAEQVERAIDALQATIGELRNGILGLRPDQADEAPLAEGLATLAREFRLTTMIDADVDTDGDDREIEVEPEQRSEVLGIVREALGNVARHARASHVRVSLRRQPAALSVTIADDGQGFALDDPGPEVHHGLAKMRAGAARLGGTLEIDSARGAGTRISLGVPLAAAGISEQRAGGVR